MKDLWSDKHSEDDCDGIDRHTIIYNLHEDIRCLKEEVQMLEFKVVGRDENGDLIPATPFANK